MVASFNYRRVRDQDSSLMRDLPYLCYVDDSPFILMGVMNKVTDQGRFFRPLVTKVNWDWDPFFTSQISSENFDTKMAFFKLGEN